MNAGDRSVADQRRQKTVVAKISDKTYLLLAGDKAFLSPFLSLNLATQAFCLSPNFFFDEVYIYI